MARDALNNFTPNFNGVLQWHICPQGWRMCPQALYKAITSAKLSPKRLKVHQTLFITKINIKMIILTIYRVADLSGWQICRFGLKFILVMAL